jgi:hypothetical protein
MAHFTVINNTIPMCAGIYMCGGAEKLSKKKSPDISNNTLHIAILNN